MSVRTISPNQFAKQVGVGVQKIHALLDAGEIKYVRSLCNPKKPNRRPHRYIPDFEVEEFLRRNAK
jgi:hypothetical protein